MTQSQDSKITIPHKKALIPSPLDSLIHEELKQAFEQGQKNGEAIGYDKAQREMKTVVNLFRKMIGNLLDKITTLKTDLQPELTEFCLKVCEKILLQELKSPEILTKVISSIISKHIESLSKNVTIFLAPQDLQKVNDWLKKNDIHTALNIKWNSDSSLKKGSFRIDISSSPILYDISTEVDNLLGHLELYRS